MLTLFLLYTDNIMLFSLDSKGRSVNYQIVRDRNPDSIHDISSWDSFISDSHTQIGKKCCKQAAAAEWLSLASFLPGIMCFYEYLSSMLTPGAEACAVNRH